jgi:hypothetical protein
MKISIRCGSRLTAAWALVTLAFSLCYAVPGITLPNGTFVDKAHFYLFLCIGNSAMSGRAPNADTATLSNQWKFRLTPANHDWKPAKEPACSDAYNSEGSPKSGPTIPLVRELGKLNPNVTVGIMQNSGSGWAQAAHLAYGKDGYDTIVKYAKQLAPNVTIAGIISMFNLVEVQNCGTAACIGDYSGSIRDMVASLRADLKTIDPALATVPYIHAGYPVMASKGTNNIDYSPTTLQALAIITEIAKIPSIIPNSVVIPTDSCTICTTCQPAGYNSHYDKAGCDRWGKRAADTIAVRTWFPMVCPNPLCTGVSGYVSGNAAFRGPAMQKILFDGSDFSAFDKAGKSFSIYSPNGRAITGLSASLLKTQNLRPGVYFVRSMIK